MRCCGGCGSCGEGPGPVKQELGERDGGGGGRGGGRGGSTRRGRGMGFEVGGLRVGGDFDVGGLGVRLARLNGRLGV